MKNHQPELISEKHTEVSELDKEQKEEYRRRLAEYLKDPTFRAIEGFPIGTDEDILALSDPPYYTACPNPFLPEIIELWQQEREEIRQKLALKDEKYQREPFAADVSEGKNDPIYNAHSYHTKVPHKAIMRYILHYTDPGDIVFDGFCGTGMTGVAAQLCGDKKTVESLCYRVDDNGLIWDGDKAISLLGGRKAILNDLSPAATFIAYNYNTPVDAAAFEREARRILSDLEKECNWMYETNHTDGNKHGQINYIIWSDIFICPSCGVEIIFWDAAVDYEAGLVRDEWTCSNCNALLSKNRSKSKSALRVEHAWKTSFDKSLNQSVTQIKQVPVIINYSIGNKRFEKKADSSDIYLLEKIQETQIPFDFPIDRMPLGDESRRNDDLGITNVHQFYSSRNIWGLASILKKINIDIPEHRYLLFMVSSIFTRASKMSRVAMSNFLHGGGGPIMTAMSGTLYIPSFSVENSIIKLLSDRLESFLRSLKSSRYSEHFSSESCQSSNSLNNIVSSSIDYVFVDPPFGQNLMYSELNFIAEAWLKLYTNNQDEAIVSKTQRKGLSEYQELMQESFKEFYRILKPGRWMTVEFHNSVNAVWNSIQEALFRVGFIVADVRTLDKQQGTFKQVNNSSAVKQDLIISVYKPNGDLEENFRLKAGKEDGAWAFIRYHLGKLPIVNQSEGIAFVNTERQAFLLFDRMVAFHIQRGVMVPLSAPEFYGGLEQRFTRRDGMYFLPDQVAEYDRAVLDSGKPTQLSLFVSDEKTAINWLRQQLDPASGGEPKTRGDLTNDFNRTMNRAKHEQPLELIEILEQNFLVDQDGKWYVPDHNKATDLEKVRLRSLLKEYNEYANSTGRLRIFRSEAVRAGFADCFKRQDYETIVKVAERLPEDVLREDPDLLMYYDSALLRKK